MSEPMKVSHYALLLLLLIIQFAFVMFSLTQANDKLDRLEQAPKAVTVVTR